MAGRCHSRTSRESSRCNENQARWRVEFYEVHAAIPLISASNEAATYVIVT